MRNSLVIFLLLVGYWVPAQEGETSPPLPLDAQITFVEVYNGQSRVEAIIHRKDSVEHVIPDVLCNLYLNEVSRHGMQGSVISDEDGKLIFPLDSKFNVSRQAYSTYHLMLRIDNDERFVPAIIQHDVQRSNLKVDFDQRGEEKQIIVHFEGMNSDWVSEDVEGALVTFNYRDSTGYTPLKPENNYTNAEGKVIFELDELVPGNAQGEVEFLVQVQHPKYDRSEYIQVTKWGADPKTVQNQQQRKHLQNRVLAVLVILGIVAWIGIRLYRKRIN